MKKKQRYGKWKGKRGDRIVKRIIGDEYEEKRR